MLNLEKREGYLNRHIDGLPKEKCNVIAITNDVDGEYEFLCKWRPFNTNDYNRDNMPLDGYLGTIKVIKGKFKGIGFHAWKQNNSEFIYYKIV